MGIIVSIILCSRQKLLDSYFINEGAVAQKDEMTARKDNREYKYTSIFDVTPCFNLALEWSTDCCSFRD